MNYSKIIYTIMDIAINQQGINYAFEGDITNINTLNIEDYPVFCVASTSDHMEMMNYNTYNLTFYYVDREQWDNERAGSANEILIHSTGQMVLSNIIKKIIEEIGVLNDVYPISYSFWNESEMFTDKCSGVFTTIAIQVPKDTNCIIE